ncbi:hypothetical protein AB0K74_34165, partial [Streptomyces sp. NPDC056159]|uniref:hypothetical protein n=1 Tax=Streptomyces sp. NPDC056159 TaxID=3155537 RepID=UPI00344A7F83
MASHAYRLCTYRYGGFTSVGLGLGENPATVIDVERCFTHLHRERRQGQFIARCTTTATAAASPSPPRTCAARTSGTRSSRS